MQQSTPLGRDDRRVRAAQVGALLRWHRQNFNREDGRQGLSQAEVLGRMAPLSSDERIVPADTSSWSRLENGVAPASRERLELFGRALDLSRVEIDGLLLLAGFEPVGQQMTAKPASAITAPADDGEAVDRDLEPVGLPAVGMFGERGIRPFLAETLNFFLYRTLLPAAAAAGAGYLLYSLGITATWIVVLYIGLAMGLVVFQGFLKMRRASNLRDLLFLSVFFVLSTPLLQTPFIRMDNYGFHNIPALAGTPFSIVLVMSANLLVALVAALGFDLLWRWQYGGRGAAKAYHRALWVAAPPFAFVYLWILLASNAGSWLGYAFVLPVMTGVFAMLVALRDESVELAEWDRRFLLWCTMVVTIILTTFGAAGILTAYMQPSFASLTGHTLIHSWAIDFAALGYPEHELAARWRMGYAWNAVTGVVYLVIVLGGSLTVSLYRLGGGDPSQPTADVGELPAGEPAKPDTVRQRIKSLFGPGRLAGRPLRPEPA